MFTLATLFFWNLKSSLEILHPWQQAVIKIKAIPFLKTIVQTQQIWNYWTPFRSVYINYS